MRPIFSAVALGLALALALAVSAAHAKPAKVKGRPAGGICSEAGFQACMNKCISNMAISNGSRITSKCSHRCHTRMSKHC